MFGLTSDVGVIGRGLLGFRDFGFFFFFFFWIRDSIRVWGRLGVWGKEKRAGCRLWLGFWTMAIWVMGEGIGWASGVGDGDGGSGNGGYGSVTRGGGDDDDNGR